MPRRPHAWSAARAALIAALFVAACDRRSQTPGADASPPPSGRWPCPQGWVAYEHGGCGPALVLCAPDGGAVAGACDAPDAAAAPGAFTRAPDGGVRGPWPAEDYEPAAGIPSCPAGWTRTPDGECDPALRADCPAGSTAVPANHCTPLATARCPAPGEYPDVRAEAGAAVIVHVREGADAARADGSVALPFATVTAGVRAAGPTGWVLIAAGTYTERLALTRGVHVIGACAASVTLRGTPPDAPHIADATVDVAAGAVLDLRGVTVVGHGASGVRAREGARALLRAVRVADCAGFGLTAHELDSEVVAEGCAIEGNRANTATGVHAAARAYDFGRVTLRGVDIARSDYTALEARESGVLDAEDTVVRDTREGPAAEGWGNAVVLDDGVLRAQRCALLRGAGHGVVVSGPLARAELFDVVVRDTGPRRSGDDAHGLFVSNEATAVARRVLVAGAHGAGVFVAGWRPGTTVPSTATVELTDSVVRDARRPRADGEATGMISHSGAVLRATRVQVRDTAGIGVLAFGQGATVELEQSTVREAHAPDAIATADGVLANEGARVTARGVLVTGAERGGFTVFNRSTLDLRDSVVRDIATHRNGLSGHGVVAINGCELVVARTLVTRTHAYGVGIGVSTRGTVEDTAIVRTDPDADGQYGVGLGTASGELDARRVWVRDSNEVGVGAALPGASARLTDVLIDGVRTSVRGTAIGLGAGAAARVDATRLAVLDVGGAAVGLSPQGPAGITGGARVFLADVFVRAVRDGTVGYNPVAPLAPTGRAVAYGLFSGPSCTLNATRAVIDGGGWGFYSAVGSLSLRTGVITHQRVVGALNGATDRARLVLEDVALSGNATDDVLSDDSLPEVQFAPPAAPCTQPPCR